MIDKIGYKRAFTIFILAGLLVLMVAGNELFIKSQVTKSQTELNARKTESTTLSGEIQKMRDDYITFEKQKDYYAIISRMGFFNDQDRVLARERFDTMQRLSKIISAKYEIKAANILSAETNPETGFVVMESPITVDLAAVDDLDIYRFVYYLNYGFPGHITINKMNITRNATVTPELLKEIGTGTPPQVVTAKLEMDWRTMARKESIQPQTTDPNAPATPATGAAQ